MNNFKSKKILTISFLLWISVNVILTVKHEPWCDEAQAWLLARELGPISVFSRLSYEGHPFLWYYTLMPFSKSGLPFEFIKSISMAVMIFTAYLVIFKCNVSFIIKILFISSPAMVYFYPSISRSYSLIALLVILSAIEFPKRNTHPVINGAILGLLLQTHIIMAGMVFVICLIWLIESIKNKNAKKSVAGMLIPSLSAVFLLWEMRGVANADAMAINGATTGFAKGETVRKLTV